MFTNGQSWAVARLRPPFAGAYSDATFQSKNSMMSNPYEPSLLESESVVGRAATMVHPVERMFCWLLILSGYLIIFCSILFIIGNGYTWMGGNRPVQIRALMLFAVASLGAIPAIVGFALLYYSKRYLRWRTNSRLVA